MKQNLNVVDETLIEEINKWGAHYSFFCELKQKIRDKKVVFLDDKNQLIDILNADLIYDEDVIMVTANG